MATERPDLNLFRVFASVMRHRSLVAAGRELGITSSAVSHSLTRLRASLGDELFVAGARGMSPTALALELSPRITNALSALGEVLAAKPFDAATVERVFRIGASDHTGAIFLPPLLGSVLEQAPGVRMRVLPIGRTDLVEQLDDGRLDLVVSWFGPSPPRIRRRGLFREREVLVVRPGHRLSGTKPSVEELLAFPHVVVELVGGVVTAPGGFYDERGFQRRVWVEMLLLNNTQRETAERLTAVTVPSFGLVAPVLHSDTDLVATLPLRLARKLAAAHDVVLLDPPGGPHEITTEVAWHERADRDPALSWLVDRMAAVCAELEPLPDSAPQ